MTGDTLVVAVVDDDHPFTKMLAVVLRYEGMRAVAYPKSTRAFDALVDLQPDLIILDTWHNQPDAGWQLLHQLRVHPTTASIPILVGSTNPTLLSARAAQLRQYHAEPFEKPFNLDDLLQKIHVALSRSGPLREQPHWPSMVRGGAYESS